MKAYNKLNLLRIHYLTIESIYRNGRGGVSKRWSSSITRCRNSDGCGNVRRNEVNPNNPISNCLDNDRLFYGLQRCYLATMDGERDRESVGGRQENYRKKTLVGSCWVVGWNRHLSNIAKSNKCKTKCKQPQRTDERTMEQLKQLNTNSKRISVSVDPK